MIKIIQFNETHLRVQCDDFGIEQELSEYFTFFAPGYKFMPSYRNKLWDGKIRLYDLRKKTLYKGLLPQLFAWCKKREYEFSIDSDLRNDNPTPKEQTDKFVGMLKLHARGAPIQPHEYQLEAIHNAIRQNRSLMLSPTSSGKSLMIYAYVRWMIAQKLNVLIVVPSTMLVEQLYSDFKDYSSHNGFDVESKMQLLYSGKDRNFVAPVVISTWQSIAAMMKSDPKNFKEITDRTDVAVWDEAHTYKAAAVLAVMEKFANTKYRLGTTGTIDDSKINGLTLQGLMGPIHQVVSTKELMDAGKVSQLAIKCIVLHHPEHVRKEMKGMKYDEEVNYLVACESRNDFIAKLAASTKGNSLVLFNFVERHGSVLYEKIKALTDRPVFFIHGGVDTDERERIRKIVETMNNAIIVATSSLMSTGTNIPSIQNIIFAIPTKSTIRVRQSIGRGLRLKDGKLLCTLWDISDDFSWKSKKNTTLEHLEARLAIYSKESFDFTITKINLS